MKWMDVREGDVVFARSGPWAIVRIERDQPKGKMLISYFMLDTGKFDKGFTARPGELLLARIMRGDQVLNLEAGEGALW